MIHCSTGHIFLWGMQGVNKKKKPQDINKDFFWTAKNLLLTCKYPIKKYFIGIVLSIRALS